MADTSPARLGSVHLDDLAIIILTTPAGSNPASTRPELSEDERARLRSRLKLIGRHDWPSSMREDPLIRRGYTLRQCFRLMTALLLLDAHVPPSVAIPIARGNELLFLRAIVARLNAPAGRASAADPIIVVMLGDLWDRLDHDGWAAVEPNRVRTLPRAELGELWSGGSDLAGAGQRLIVDVGGVATTLWDWIRSRDLMPMEALAELIAGIEKLKTNPGYSAEGGRSIRR